MTSVLVAEMINPAVTAYPLDIFHTKSFFDSEEFLSTTSGTGEPNEGFALVVEGNNTQRHGCKQYSQRQQITVRRMKKMSRKSTCFHQRSANKPQVRSTFGFSDFVVVIPLRIWDFDLSERTQPCLVSFELFSRCVHVRHFQFVQPLSLLTRFFHHQSVVATQR